MLFFKIGLILACALVFGPALSGQFLAWDDTQHIQLNSHLLNGDYLYFWQNAYYGLYAPVTYSLWTSLWQTSHNPALFHLFNLLLHICNVLMVYGLLKRILDVDDESALIGAMIFAFHPLQVEPVAWISGGRDLLAAFFGLSAMSVWASRKRTLYVQSSGILLFALGALSKPSLAVLPAALLAFDLLRKEKMFSRTTLGLCGALGAAVLAYTFLLQAPGTDPRLTASVPELLLVGLDSAGFYVKLFFAPWPLSFSYDRLIEDVIAGRLYLWGLFYLSLGAVPAICLARRFGRTVPAALAFAFILLLPVLGLVPFAGQAQSTVFDRYMYLPLFGVALIAGFVSQVRGLRLALAGVIVVMTALSFARAREWRSDRTLTESALQIDPANYLALNNLALVEIKEGDFQGAENHLRAAWDTRPTDALAPANLAHVLWKQNDVGSVLQEIKPLTETQIFLEYNQREPEALSLIHRMTARAQNATLDRAGARLSYEKALAYRPDDRDLRSEIGLFEKEK